MHNKALDYGPVELELGQASSKNPAKADFTQDERSYYRLNKIPMPRSPQPTQAQKAARTKAAMQNAHHSHILELKREVKRVEGMLSRALGRLDFAERDFKGKFPEGFPSWQGRQG
jgi:hypothetical protein